MKTIGIIGASGQVGTEVCLFLKTYTDVRVIAIVRTPVSGALLKRLGVECRMGTLGNEQECQELLADCDLVVDFSVVIGEVSKTKRHYFNNVAKALQYSQPGAKYVFISTINAFGMSEQFNRAKKYFIPHSIYAVTKRYGEQIAAKYGRKYGKEVYSFRLGHVHGLLQRVSHETQELVNGRYRIFEYPDTPSYTIFCFTIAEGLVNILEGKEKPGVYTLVSEPAWSWKEVLEYYLEDGRDIDVRLVSLKKDGFLKKIPSTIKRSIFSFLTKYKDTMRANILHRIPDTERKYKAKLYVQRVHTQVGDFNDQFIYRPEGVHEGVFPGKRLQHCSDSRAVMQEKTKAVQEMLQALVQEPASIKT